jgi:hypothetical protein
MPTAGRLTPDEETTIRDMHAAGASLGQIATELGRSKSTVSKFAARHHLAWGDDRTAKATEAKVATNRDKRAALETRFLDEAALLLDALHQPHTAFNFGGKDNTYEEHELPEPDVQSKRTLIQAAGTAVDKAVKLADLDRAGDGAEAGKSLVGSMFVALRTIPIDDQGEA